MEESTKRKMNFNGDSVGIALSGACLVHCAALPFVAFLSPTIASITESEWIHLTLLFFLIPIAFFTFLSGKKYHKNAKPLIIGMTGIASLVLALILEAFHIEAAEVGLTVLGSLILCYAHYLNFSLRRNCSTEAC